MMKLGLQSAILPDYTFEQVIDTAAEIGYKCVEVCCWPKGKALRRYAGVTHIDVNELTAEKAKYYLDYAAQKGIELSSLSYYPNPLDPDLEKRQAYIDHIYRLIDAAKLMGLDTVCTFIGRDKTKNVEDNLEEFARVWPPIIQYAEKQGIKIAIENCPMLFSKDEWPGGVNLACTPAIWRRMFELIPNPNFGLNYDPSHPYLLDMSYTKPLYEFKDRIFHVHFKDIKIYQEKLDEVGRFAYPLQWHSPKIPGLGDIDFGAFVSALNDIGYKGCACVEVEDKAFEKCEADVLEAVRISYNYMRNFLA